MSGLISCGIPQAACRGSRHLPLPAGFGAVAAAVEVASTFSRRLLLLPLALAASLGVLLGLEVLPAVLAGADQLGDGVHGGVKVLLVLGGGGLVVVGLPLAVGAGHVAGEGGHGLEDGVALAALELAFVVLLVVS